MLGAGGGLNAGPRPLVDGGQVAIVTVFHALPAPIQGTIGVLGGAVSLFVAVGGAAVLADG